VLGFTFKFGEGKCVSLVFARGRRAGYTLGFATHFHVIFFAFLILRLNVISVLCHAENIILIIPCTLKSFLLN